MITLKTLPQATAQEVFDQVARHLLKQEARSVEVNSHCRYRYKKMKCAAGCLIGDDEYHPSMEENCWATLSRKQFNIPNEHMSLIQGLQTIHDSRDVCDWESELKELATMEDLKWNL